MSIFSPFVPFRKFFSVLCLMLCSASLAQAGDCWTPLSAENPVLGEQKVAVILIDFAQDGQQQTVEQVQDAMFNLPGSIKSFYEAISFGKVTLSGDVFGWYNFPPLAGCIPTTNEYKAMLALLPSTVNPTDYSRFVFIFNGHTATCAAGQSTIGKQSLQVPQGEICASFSWTRSKFYFPTDFSKTTNKTLAHEMLHGFGVGFHANSYISPTTPLPLDSTGCEIQAYGDLFDIMGVALQASHPNGIIKQQLGWLEPSNYIEVPEKPGQYVYTLSSVSTAGSALKTVVVKLPNPVGMLTFSGGSLPVEKLAIEYRNMTGFDYRTTWYRDVDLIGGGVFEITSTDGALIRGVNCSLNGFCITDLLDMHSASIANEDYALNEVADAYLYPDEEFVVEGNPVSIKTLSKVPGQSITIQVTIAEPKTQFCPGDLDNSGAVDAADLGVLLAAFGSRGSAADLNGDGVVGPEDLGLLLANWGVCQ